MKTYGSLILLISLLFSWACQNTSDSQTSLSEQKTPVFLADSQEANEALSLLKINCYACHNPAAPSHDEILAPPLAAVKFRYLRSYPEREAFIAGMTEFMRNPVAENALMRNAVERFNVMVKLPTDEATLQQLAAYIYDIRLEEPAWFAEHFEEEHGQKWQP